MNVSRPILAWLLPVGLLLGCLLLPGGCLAEPIPRAPTDRIIEGPYTLTPQWQTVRFNEPLQVIPHIQKLFLLLDHDLYEVPMDLIMSEEQTSTSMSATERLQRESFRHIASGVVVVPEVIFIDRQGRQLQAVIASLGSFATRLGPFKTIGFSTDMDNGKLLFSRGTEISAVKIRANITMRVEHLQWSALRFHRNPDFTWEEVDPSVIQSFE